MPSVSDRFKSIETLFACCLFPDVIFYFFSFAVSCHPCFICPHHDHHYHHHLTPHHAAVNGTHTQTHARTCVPVCAVCVVQHPG